MPDRLRVLISAYACEPNKGSEPEVGWQWVRQMARFHDVTVLTRTNNRPSIESATARDFPSRSPRFIYHDCGPVALALKRRLRVTQFYYVLWQRSAARVIAKLVAKAPFDLLHHVTFAAFRYPAAIWGHGIPSIWGPVGGAETIPAGLLPWGHPASLAREGLRNLDTRLRTSKFSSLCRRARATTTLLASTREMQRTFRSLGFESTLMPTIGLNPSDMPAGERRTAAGSPLSLLYTGNVIALKGLDLALDALSRVESPVRFTIVGDGNFLNPLQRQAERLGIRDSVVFLGRQPRTDVLRLYAQHDLFLFPSLHDTGGYSVLEAMYYGLPVICLDCAGPAIAVADHCGTRVPLNSRQNIVEEMASAISTYAADRRRIVTEGNAARQHVRHAYDWDRKGEQMDRVYRETVK